MSSELQWFTQRPISTLVRYEVESYLDFHGNISWQRPHTYRAARADVLPHLLHASAGWVCAWADEAPVSAMAAISMTLRVSKESLR